jgi:hypothetical protein
VIPFATLLRRAGSVLATVMLIAFAALSLWHGGRIAWSDAGSLAARWTVSQWRNGRGPAPAPALWSKTRDDLRGALQITPDNAQLLDDLGYLHASRAQAMGWPEIGSPQESLRQSLLAEAVVNYRAATLMRPTFPYSWTYLALAKHLQGQQDAVFWLAFDKALQYGSTEAGVQPILAELAFAQGQGLTSQRERLVFSMLTSSHGAVRKRLAGLIQKNGATVPGF